MCSHSNSVFMFRALALKFQSFIFMCLELIYVYKVSDLFLIEPRAFEIFSNPENLA